MYFSAGMPAVGHILYQNRPRFWGNDRRQRMKKRNWISILLILLCLGTLMGYRALVRMRTDAVAPEITMEEQLLELSALEPRSAMIQGVTAWDNVDGDVTGSLVVESVRLLRSDGTVTVTYAAFDKAGNVAKAQREVRFTDYESPRFSLSQPLLFAQNMSYNVLSLISAQDMLDGNISHRIRATVLDEVNTGYTGTHEIQFRVTNTLGETVELVLPVEVYTPGLFEGSLTLTDYLVYLKQGDKFNGEDYLSTFSLGREAISLRNGIPEDMKLNTSGKVETGVPGVYVVDYEISCQVGTQPYTGYSKLIVVVEG